MERRRQLAAGRPDPATLPDAEATEAPTGRLTLAVIRDELARILRVYGEERFARQIAAAIVRRRDTDPIVTSSQLVELLYDTIPQGARRTGGHPGKRVFQALRIAVNDELGELTPQSIRLRKKILNPSMRK